MSAFFYWVGFVAVIGLGVAAVASLLGWLLMWRLEKLHRSWKLSRDFGKFEEFARWRRKQGIR